MNERIKELSEQCYHRYSVHYIDLEKFAELIVRECIDVVEDAGGIDKYHYTRAIGKHFGVEE